jgi:hypothetical protein
MAVDMDINAEIIALIGVVLTLITALFGGFKYFNAEIAGVRREADHIARTFAANEGKARHDMNNQVTILIARLDLELNKMRDQHNALSLEVVRKTDLAAFEARIMQGIIATEQRQISALDKIETLRQGQFSHLEGKLERLVESLRTTGQNVRERENARA